MTDPAVAPVAPATDTETDATPTTTSTDNTTVTRSGNHPDTAMTTNTDVTPALTPDDTTLGSIAYSNTHMDYIAQTFRDDERADPPSKDEYAFGQPVYAIQTGGPTTHAVIGVIYDTELVDPDQGRDGPRLSAPEQEMFVPGYINEKRTLLGIALLGTAEVATAETETEDAAEGEPAPDGVSVPQVFTTVSQSMPRWTLDIDAFVYALPDPGFRQFHVRDGSLRLEYYQRLIATAGQFGPEVTLAILDRLRRVTDVDSGVLDVIEKKIRWQSSSDRGVVR